MYPPEETLLYNLVFKLPVTGHPAPTPRMAMLEFIL